LSDRHEAGPYSIAALIVAIASSIGGVGIAKSRHAHLGWRGNRPYAVPQTPPTESVHPERRIAESEAAMKVAAAVAEILKREGVEFLIAYPVNPLIEAAAEADIRTIIVRQERTGLHMADAVSRVTSGERVGVFAMQQGPGTENAFGGVAQAHADSSPIVVLPAGFRRAAINVPPSFNAFLNYQHVTKSIEQVILPSAVPDALRRAFTQVRNGRPRPVLVEIPADVFAEELPGELTYRPAPRARGAPDPAAVDEVARVLAEAQRPVIYAGQGVHYAQAWPQLRKLAELLEAPVTTSLQGKSAFPETHPLALGSGGRSIPGPVHRFLSDADVIFGIGCSFASTTYGVAMPHGKTIIHATLDPADLNKDVPVDHALLGDAGLTLDAVIAAVAERIGGKPRGRSGAVATEIAAVRERWLAEWMPKLTSDEAPLSPYRVIWDLLHTVDVANTIITHDAGSPRDQLSPFWVATEPLGYIGWGKSTQLGYGLGLAMGAKLARPEKLCINVWGDAAIGFTGMDFETAVRERIPILSVLLNNFSMAIELPVMQVATEKYRSTDISGHYADMARAFGGYGERVTTPGEIVPAIRRAIAQTAAGTPALLEFITAKEIDVSVFR
jgi:acetolactate synthase-1/2/3 large subunit